MKLAESISSLITCFRYRILESSMQSLIMRVILFFPFIKSKE